MKMRIKNVIILNNTANYRVDKIKTIVVLLSLLIIASFFTDAWFRHQVDFHQPLSSSSKQYYGLKFIRDEIEKASYPNKIYKKISIVFSNSLLLPFLISPQQIENAYNEINFNNINNYNFFYKAGNANSNELIAPLSNESIKFISFKICNSKNFNNNFQSTEQSKITSMAFYWKGTTISNLSPSILYQRISIPPDIDDKTEPVELISNVNKIFINVEKPNINNNYNKMHNCSMISIAIETTDNTESKHIKITEGTKAMCNVFPDPSL